MLGLPMSVRFPYTTLFRSHDRAQNAVVPPVVRGDLGEVPIADSLGQLETVAASVERPDVPEERVVEDQRGGRLEIGHAGQVDRKSTRLNSSHLVISYAVFC